MDLEEDMPWVEALADRFADYGNKVREAIDQADSWGDKGTADLFTEASRKTDKNLYFLEAHLRGRPAGPSNR
jgi:starvation-inducible DNA-binding protein